MTHDASGRPRLASPVQPPLDLSAHPMDRPRETDSLEVCRSSATKNLR